MIQLDVQARTVPTEFVQAGGVTYAYRKLGLAAGVPLVCLQHFTGTLDNWDPALVDALAAHRAVILFESAGIGRSTGATPDTVAGMADHVVRFMDALGLSQVDVLGFSLGGMVAQVIALTRPERLRRIILAGTGPQGGEGTSMARPELLAIFTDQQMPMNDKLRTLFFSHDDAGQAEAHSFVQRLASRTEDREPEATPSVAVAQLTAMAAWEKAPGEPWKALAKIQHPVLVTNGDNDWLIPTENSFTLSRRLPNAQLIIYPHSGHGALFQFHSSFAAHVNEFLDR